MRTRHDDKARRGPAAIQLSHGRLEQVAQAMAGARPEVAAVYLFGSRARRSERPGSDLDLAVLLQEPAAAMDRLWLQAELARFVEDRVGLPVDVVLVDRSLPPGLLFDIFAIETILYTRDPEQAHQLACSARGISRTAAPSGPRLRTSPPADRGTSGCPEPNVRRKGSHQDSQQTPLPPGRACHMDTIQFQIKLLKAEGYPIASIWINGRDLVDRVREVEAPFAARDGHPDQAGQYVALPSAEIFLPSRHLLGKPCRRHSWGNGKLPVLGCKCGESGCWPLLVRITAGQVNVTWSEFEQPHRREGSRSYWRYDQLGPFVFDRQQYETALVEPRPYC